MTGLSPRNLSLLELLRAIHNGSDGPEYAHELAHRVDALLSARDKRFDRLEKTRKALEAAAAELTTIQTLEP